MLKLIRLSIYLVIGYMLYELFQGLNAQPRAAGQSRGEIAPGDTDASTQPGVGTMTGPARQGKRVQTEEASGESMPHIVGRGVV